MIIWMFQGGQQSPAASDDSCVQGERGAALQGIYTAVTDSPRPITMHAIVKKLSRL